MSVPFSLFSPLSASLTGHSRAVDTTGADMTNINSPGTKRSAVHFADLVRSASRSTEQNTSQGNQPFRRQNIAGQGVILPSNDALEIAIQGEGFFLTRNEDSGRSDLALSRNGSFKLRIDDRGQGDRAWIADQEEHYVLGWTADSNGNLPAGKTVESADRILLDKNFQTLDFRATNQARFHATLPGRAPPRQRNFCRCRFGR